MKNQSFEALKSFAISKIRNVRRGSKEKSAMKHSWWQSYQPLLEHFLKSNLCMLYVVSKLKKSTIQCFKQYTIWSWNEGVTSIASWSLQAEERILHSTAKSPFCCEMISQPFCTVLWISPWSFPSRWKPNTTSWKTTSQRCKISHLLRSDFAALFEHLQNLADLVCTCEMVLSASRYLRPTLGDIFHQIFVV